MGYSKNQGVFLVAWEQRADLGPDPLNGEIVCRQIDSDFSLSTLAVVADASDDNSQPDLASEASGAQNDLLIVWRNSSLGIQIRQVDLVDNLIPLPLGSATTLGFDGLDFSPAISKNGGDSDVHMVTWQRLFLSPAPGDHDIYGIAVDAEGVALTSATALVSSIGPNEENPDVDGDGQTFVLAFDREAVIDDGDAGVYARKYELGAGFLSLSGPEIVVDDDLADDETNPAVGFAEAEFFVAYQDSYTTGLFDIFMLGFGIDDCEVCEAETMITFSGINNFGPEIATSESGGEDLFYADIVFTRNNSGVQSIQFQAVDDSARLQVANNLGGACGSAGSVSFSGGFTAVAPSYLGSSEFSVELSGADPLATLAVLNINANPLPITCGTCVWNPFRTTLTASVVGGSASVDIPIPCRAELAGKSAQVQWTVLLTGTSPCSISPNVSNSDRVEVFLGY